MEGGYERGRNATPELLAALSFSPLFADDGVLGLNLDATYVLTQTRPLRGGDVFKDEYLIHYLSSAPKWVRVYQDVGEHLNFPREVKRAEFENLSREEVTVRGGKRGELYLLDVSPSEGNYYMLWWEEVEAEFEPVPGGVSRKVREEVLATVLARGLSREEVLQLAELLHP
jgi:hypothetical protein